MNAIETIRERARADLFKNKNLAEAERLYALLKESEIPGTYMWEDVNYADRDKAIWLTSNHLNYILTILSGFGEERILNDKKYVEKIEGAINYWLEHDFINPNWWCNEVYVPRALANICLMMYPVINPDIIDRVVRQNMPRGSMALRKEIFEKWTGANLIWGARNTIRHALMVSDASILKLAVDSAANEIYIGGDEGIQDDGSFYQHGHRLYSGGYGLAYINEIASLSNLLAGTEYQFGKEKLNMLVYPMLDGLWHMTQGDALDFACIGRNISRPGCVKNTLLKTVLNELYKNPDMPRRDEIKKMIDFTVAGAGRENETKYFPKVTMLCHHFDGIYVGAKFLDNTTFDAETCNHEGVLCYNLSYGTHTCIMRDGYEYIDIDCIWDYSRIPGTTSRTENNEQLLAHLNKDWRNKTLPNEHFGGEHKGNRGIVYELDEHDGIVGYVTDFAFEGGFISLGAAIEDTSGKNEALVTTVDQSFLRGEVKNDGGAYLHNGIRYTPLGSTVIEAEAKRQEGSWKRNNYAQSADMVAADVLTLTIKHKSGEVSDYAYMISSADKCVPEVKVLRNDADIQAIMLSDGSVMAVFHKPCELSIDGRVIKGDTGTYIE